MRRRRCDCANARTLACLPLTGCMCGGWVGGGGATAPPSLDRVRPGQSISQLELGFLRGFSFVIRCRVASMPNGRRLLQGACEPSHSMFPRRARATRVRGVPQPIREYVRWQLEQEQVTAKVRRAQAYSVVGRAVECMRREEPRRQMPLADGRERGVAASVCRLPGAPRGPSTAPHRMPIFHFV